MLLLEEHKSQRPGYNGHRYAQFFENQRRYAKSLKRRLRQIHCAGLTVELIGGSCTLIFIAAQGASRYIYAFATPR
jgi:hypothetical protein